MMRARWIQLAGAWRAAASLRSRRSSAGSVGGRACRSAGMASPRCRYRHDHGTPSVTLIPDLRNAALVGQDANGGREWQPVSEPERVLVHDFPDEKLGKAIPYGGYDLGANAGWVSVGIDHDTAAFAVATIRRWWEQAGRVAYPQATRLLVTADAGGSNGDRVRAWKTELARLAAETGLAITVCHLPPGTSKWNRIEHRLFSHISMNWRGRPLVSHEVILELIAATRTRPGRTAPPASRMPSAPVSSQA